MEDLKALVRARYVENHRMYIIVEKKWIGNRTMSETNKTHILNKPELFIGTWFNILNLSQAWYKWLPNGSRRIRPLKMGVLIHYIPNDYYFHLKLPRCFVVIITRFGVLTAVYYAMSHRILLCMDNCCITWMWYISLSGQLSLPLSGVLILQCRFFASACSLQALTGGTNWRGYTLTHACGDGLHWQLLICCLLTRNQIRPCILW